MMRIPFSILTWFSLTAAVANGFSITTPATIASSYSTSTSTSARQRGSLSSSLLVVLRSTAEDAAATSGTSEDDGTGPKIAIAGNNLELTPALTDYVNKRIGGNLSKLTNNGSIRECEVHLSVNKNPKVKNAHRVEVTTNLVGTTIHSKAETPDMYESIDAVAHALNRKLRKYKERRQEGWHGGSKTGDDLMAVLEEMEQSWEEEDNDDDAGDEFADPEKPVVTSVKSYDLSKPTSLEEAVFALDYTDHDFYAFKNKDTGAINVVYKRNAGGIGHVEP